jgi:hypothetical protein
MMEREQRRRRWNRPGSRTALSNWRCSSRSVDVFAKHADLGVQTGCGEEFPSAIVLLAAPRSTQRGANGRATSIGHGRPLDRSCAPQPSSGRQARTQLDFKPSSDPIPGMDWVPVHVEKDAARGGRKFAKSSPSAAAARSTRKQSLQSERLLPPWRAGHRSTGTREVRIYLRRRCRRIPATAPHFQQCRMTIACKKEVGGQRAVAAAFLTDTLLSAEDALHSPASTGHVPVDAPRRLYRQSDTPAISSFDSTSIAAFSTDFFRASWLLRFV